MQAFTAFLLKRSSKVFKPKSQKDQFLIELDPLHLFFEFKFEYRKKQVKIMLNLSLTRKTSFES